MISKIGAFLLHKMVLTYKTHIIVKPIYFFDINKSIGTFSQMHGKTMSSITYRYGEVEIRL